MTKQTTTKVEVKLQPLNIKTTTIELVGKTPLLMDKFPEEVQNQILAKQTGLSKGNKKMVRDVKAEQASAIHITSNGKIGYPEYGFKKGMMEVTSFIGDKAFSKKLVSGAVKITNAVDGLIPIKYQKQTILKHNIGHNVKFSPQFIGWSCKLEIQYEANNISLQDIVTLLNYAGYYIGVGAWRPKCRDGGSGSFGLYEVAKTQVA